MDETWVLTTPDGLMTIEDSRTTDGLIRIFGAGRRMVYCFEVTDVMILDDTANDTDIIEIVIGQSQPCKVYLNSSEEAAQIAEFLSLPIYEINDGDWGYVIKGEA